MAPLLAAPASAQRLGDVLPATGVEGTDPRGVRVAASLALRADGNVGLDASDERSGLFASADLGAAGTVSTGAVTVSAAAGVRREEPLGEVGEPRSGGAVGARLAWTPSTNVAAEVDASLTEAVEEGVDAPFQLGGTVRRRARRQRVAASLAHYDLLGLAWDATASWSDARFEDQGGAGVFRADDRQDRTVGLTARRVTGFGEIEAGLSRAEIEGERSEAVIDRAWAAVTLGRGQASTLRAQAGVASRDGAGGPTDQFATWRLDADWRPVPTATLTASASRDLRVAYVGGGLTARRRALGLSAEGRFGERGVLEAEVGRWADEFEGGAREEVTYVGGTLSFALRERLDAFVRGRWSARAFAPVQGDRVTVDDPSVFVGLRVRWD